MKKRYLPTLPNIFVVFITLMFFSCEQQEFETGNTLIGDGRFAEQISINTLSYNGDILAGDSIRTDRRRLSNVVIGAHDEPVFGKIKSSFYTQVRLNSFNPDFQDNPAVDSVKLMIPIAADTSSDPLTEVREVYYEKQNDDEKDSIRITRTYPIDSLYGETTTMTVQVEEVTDYMGTINNQRYSNALFTNFEGEPNNFATGQTLGSVSFDGTVTQEEILVSDDASNEDNDQSISSDTPSYLEIELDENFFDTKILQASAGDLGDQQSFIYNVLRGLKISVLEDQGFLFSTNPGAILLNMYYSYDDSDEDDGRNDATYALNLNSVYNVRYSQFENQYAGDYLSALGASSTPSENIFLAGMTPSYSSIELDATQLTDLKDNIDQKGWIITDAHFKLYVNDAFDLPTPRNIFAWLNYDEMQDDGSMENVNVVFPDLTANDYNQNVPNLYSQFTFPFQFDNDDTNDYYIIRITEFMKNLLEREVAYDNFRVNVALGSLFIGANGYLSSRNPYENSRAYDFYRTVLHGGNSSDTDKQLKLYVTVIKPN